MIINKTNITNVLNAISTVMSVDKEANELEIKLENNDLFFCIATQEFYVKTKLSVGDKVVLNEKDSSDFKVCVDATTFTSLVSALPESDVELTLASGNLQIKSGKSKYKLPVILKDSEVKSLTEIVVTNPSISFTIKQNVFTSILEHNLPEIKKVEKLNVNQLMKMCYITKEGCLNVSHGSCLNSFELDGDVQLLLSSKVVKLFKLLDSDTDFKFGKSSLSAGTVQAQISLSTANTSIAAIVNSDPVLLTKMQGPFAATKRYLSQEYLHAVELPVKETIAAIDRLAVFNKNINVSATKDFIPVMCNLSDNCINFQDKINNIENIDIENSGEYSFGINLVDFRSILATCKQDTITLKCGATSGNKGTLPLLLIQENVINVIPEVTR